jgi:hypothetical protein
MKYFNELKRSMDFIVKDHRTVFLSQTVTVPWTSMSSTLIDVPIDRVVPEQYDFVAP